MHHARKGLLGLILFIVFVQVVFAQELQVKLEPNQARMKQNETAAFALTLFHETETTEFFEIYSPDITWDIRPEKPLRVEPYRLFETKLLVRPLKVAPGLYNIPLNFRISGTKAQVKKNILLEVLPVKDGESYVPAFKGNVTLASKVDPREPVRVLLTIQNLNRRQVQNLFAKLRSDVLNQDYETSLGSLEKKTIEIVVKLDPKTEPKKDVLRISLIKSEGDKTYQYDIPPKEYEIIRYGGIEERIEETKSLLRYVYDVTLVNSGNSIVTHTFAFPTNVFQRVFTKESAPGKRVGPFVTWEVTLEPEEKAQIQIVRNYRVIVGIIFLGLFAFGAYVLFRTPIVLKKRATYVRTREHDTSELKVRITVKNRSFIDLTEIGVIDVVPKIAELLRKFDTGTLEPEKVTQTEGRGTVLKWTIDSLAAGEEHYLTYRIVSKFPIIGTLSLPAAHARVALKSGRVKSANSSSARVEKKP